MSDEAEGSQVHRNPTFGAPPHEPDCLCMCCTTRDHPAGCWCWQCESRRWFFEPPPEPKRVLVSTDETARHLRKFGMTERALARELGLGASTVNKLMTPGLKVLRETAAVALAFEGAPDDASSGDVRG